MCTRANAGNVLLRNAMRTMIARILRASITALFVPTVVFAAKLENPLGSAESVQLIVKNIIHALLGVVGSIALLVFIYGGVLWLTAHGEEKQVKQGWDTMIWAAMGIGVIFASYALVKLVFGALGVFS